MMDETGKTKSGITIRRSTAQDIPAILDIYAKAKRYMRANGNMTQWSNGYPSQESVEADIEAGNSYVGIDGEGETVMTFAFITGEDPTYARIEDGAWINDEPYGTIHRIGSNGKHAGMLRRAVEFGRTLADNIRLDTHADNKPMQKAALNLGFERCGIIYLKDGSPRTAFQLVADSTPLFTKNQSES